MNKSLIAVLLTTVLTSLSNAGDEGCHDVKTTKAATTVGGGECGGPTQNYNDCKQDTVFTETRYPAERECGSGQTYKGCTSKINTPAKIEHYTYWCDLTVKKVKGIPTPLLYCNEIMSPAPTSTDNVNINDAEGLGGVCQCPSA